MRKTVCTLLSVFILLSFSGCTLPSYEDTNGDADFSLQSITDQDILNGTNIYKTMSSTTTVNSKTVSKAKTLSGVEELFSKKFDNETLDIAVSCEITKGNARLVLVIDDRIVHDFNVNKENQHFILENVVGKVYLKLAGENCGYTVTYELR